MTSCDQTGAYHRFAGSYCFHFHDMSKLPWNRKSAVGRANRLSAEWSGFPIPVRAIDLFSTSNCPDRLWNLPSLQMVPGSYTWVRRTERAVGHSPSYNAKVNNRYSYTSWPLVYLPCQDQENLTFHFTSTYQTTDRSKKKKTCISWTIWAPFQRNVFPNGLEQKSCPIIETRQS